MGEGGMDCPEMYRPFRLLGSWEKQEWAGENATMSNAIRRFVCFFMGMLFCLGAFPVWALESTVLYSSVNTITNMSASGDLLWCATPGGVVRWNTKDFTYTVFTIADGLPDTVIQSIAAGRDGTVWAGTKKGACRYDGNVWKTFTQKDGLYTDSVSSVAVDSHGVAWFGTIGHGLSRYADGVWTTFPDTDAQIVVIDNSDNLWCTSWGKGISRFDGKEWTLFSDQKFHYLDDLSVSPDGVIWVVSAMEINWYADGKWNALSHSELQTSFNTPHAGARDGVCWTTYGQETGIIRIDSKTKTAKRVPFPDGYPLVVLLSATVGDDDVAWFGSRAGIFRFDGSQWKVLRVTDSLASNNTTALSVGQSGILWVGTREGGVSSFDGTQWRTYTRDNGLADDCVMFVATGPEGEVWVATYNSKKAVYSGLSRFNGAKWETYDPSKVLPGSKINSLAVDLDGALWVATEREITRFDGSEWTVFQSPESNYVYSMAVDASGVVWICTEQLGVSRFDNQKWISVPFDQNYHGESPRKLAFGKGKIYCSYDYVEEFTNNKWKGIGGINGNGSLAVGPYGEPWIGHDYSVWIYTGFSWRMHTISEQTVGNMACDGKDGMWIGTVFEGVRHMTAPPGIRGKVTVVETGQAIPGAVVIITPGDYVLYTDEFGSFQITDMAAGSYSVKARIAVNGDPDHLEIVKEGITVSANSMTEVNLSFPSNITGVSEEPATFRVGLPYPNPFNPSTSIEFTLPAKERATLAVYDITGRKVRELPLRHPSAAGAHTAVWDGRDANGKSGFLRRLHRPNHHEPGGGVVNRKMTLLR